MVQGRAVEIRGCVSHNEFNECVALQRAVWRFADLDIVTADLLLLAAKTGGQVLGAFDQRRMIGFAYSCPALRPGLVYLHSHMVAVLPEYQNQGVGRQLKLAQREEALSRDIKLIEWTFDPLEIRNAHFNIARLGVVIRRYEPDLYGITSSPLHRGIPTDRLFAEWWLDSEHVNAVLTGRQENCAKDRGITFAEPTAKTALEIQTKLRREFQESFREGLVVTGFERGERKGTYWLSRSRHSALGLEQ
jgi:predicted GNAT superfamily acetyltransferase